jgi:hypothetical protein
MGSPPAFRDESHAEVVPGAGIEPEPGIFPDELTLHCHLGIYTARMGIWQKSRFCSSNLIDGA